LEFLDIINFDFQTPGSLCQRWGSTQYVSQNFGVPVKALFEYSKLDGSSYLVTGGTGGIWSGATTGTAQGLSLNLLNATFVAGSWYGFIQAVLSGGTIFTTENGGGLYYQGSPNSIIGAGQTFYINPNVHGDNNLSFAVLNNYLFMADGNKFIKYDGVTTYPVGLPPPLRTTTNGSAILANGSSAYPTNLVGASDFLGFDVKTVGAYGLYCSYVNNRGFEGPVWPIGAIGASINGGSIAGQGGSFVAWRFALLTPLHYGISAINLYVYYAGGSLVNHVAFENGNFGFDDPKIWNYIPSLIRTIPASGSTITWVVSGSTAGGQSLLQSNGGVFPPTTNYVPLGFTNGVNAQVLDSGGIQQGHIDITSYYPRYLEIYQNRLFSAGFSLAPSFVWFSDVAEPEGYTVDANFEVRTNDSDYITALRAYGSALFIFKSKSFHILNGDNPNNFYLSQVSDQYGCVNNKCTVLFESLMAFLDKKGVILYNGANMEHLSLKVQPVLILLTI
jgi:hypothetical protein